MATEQSVTVELKLTFWSRKRTDFAKTLHTFAAKTFLYRIKLLIDTDCHYKY